MKLEDVRPRHVRALVLSLREAQHTFMEDLENRLGMRRRRRVDLRLAEKNEPPAHNGSA